MTAPSPTSLYRVVKIHPIHSAVTDLHVWISPHVGYKTGGGVVIGAMVCEEERAVLVGWMEDSRGNVSTMHAQLQAFVYNTLKHTHYKQAKIHMWCDANPAHIVNTLRAQLGNQHRDKVEWVWEKRVLYSPDQPGVTANSPQRLASWLKLQAHLSRLYRGAPTDLITGTQSIDTALSLIDSLEEKPPMFMTDLAMLTCCVLSL